MIALKGIALAIAKLLRCLYHSGMTYDDLIKHFRTQERIAASLGIQQPSVSLWRKRGIPKLRQMQIQLVTAGRLVANQRIDQKREAFYTQKHVLEQ